MPGASGPPPVYPVVGPAARSHRTRTRWSNHQSGQTRSSIGMPTATTITSISSPRRQ
jgi:hypothetical protein